MGQEASRPARGYQVMEEVLRAEWFVQNPIDPVDTVLLEVTGYDKTPTVWLLGRVYVNSVMQALRGRAVKVKIIDRLPDWAM